MDISAGMLRYEEVHVMDLNAEFYGVPTSTLMENAGRSVADVVLNRFHDCRKVSILCGGGNNGGDGLVAARFLQESGISVRVHLLSGSMRTDLAKRALTTFMNRGGRVMELREDLLREADIIVDAMLGVGAKGEPREPFLSAIRSVNASGRPVVSVDVPSGLGTSTSVSPAVTVTFTDLKVGMDEGSCGDIVVADIGIPREAWERTGPGEMSLFPISSPGSHKGENGRVLVIGGGPFHGAPILAGLSAYRTGADLVHLAVPDPVVTPARTASPSLIVHALRGDRLDVSHLDELAGSITGFDAVVIGPGAGTDPATSVFIRRSIEACSIPLVVDADAFSALAAGGPVDLSGKRCVLTPHCRELEALLKAFGLTLSPGRDGAVELARRTGTTVLLKGQVDIITDGERVKENHFGNPGMTVGGTGDVLAGCCGALLARGLGPFDAARVAVYLVTRAGDEAFLNRSYAFIAEDVVDAIPTVLVRHLRER